MLSIGSFHDVEIADAMGPDLVAVGASPFDDGDLGGDVAN